MSVVICPWCQSEIPQEEGAEPEKYCPVCENELDGYRTLRFELDRAEDGVDPGAKDDSEEESEADLRWMEDRDLTEKNESLLLFEEAVEGLLDEQDAVPECPLCREYMLEAGERIVPAESFRPRVPESLGDAILKAPFSLTVYICPSCFAVQHALSDRDRAEVGQRLSRAGEGRKGRKGDKG